MRELSKQAKGPLGSICVQSEGLQTFLFARRYVELLRGETLSSEQTSSTRPYFRERSFQQSTFEGFLSFMYSKWLF
jgi:hypothetical protein